MVSSNFKSQSACVALFAKPAIPGRVKTRLVAPEHKGLNAEGVAALYGAFVGDLSEELLRGAFALQVAWDLRAGERPAEHLLSRPLPGFCQRGDNLGSRMFHALGKLATEYPHVAVVGSDHPTLEAERVQEAFESLRLGIDVVIGPATDGGYYLIATRREALHEYLFDDIEWSTDRVLAQTLERCRERGLEARLLAPASDVDEPEDLVRLLQELSALPEHRCPRTRSLINQMRWLEAVTGEESR